MLWYEAQANDNALLVFDGSVLEVFGLSGTHRYHIWQEPRLQFSDGARPRVTIIPRRGPCLSLAYDAHRLDGLRALADRLARVRAAASGEREPAG
ncbi:hypothetical protein AB0P17_27700 [Streptomyces sp. NPDC088124]|uniref:hypothetical protein n=1 Tax=Streptomyces sp. NPDC088124 TaxID=3154654 RepID=UPI003425E43D